MLIYVDKITPRINYVMEFIFHQRGLEFELTDDFESYSNSSEKKFSFSQLKELNPHFLAASLLFEDDIQELNVEKNGLNPLTINGINDPFSSIFYVLTRYEEYTCVEKDQFDRFPYSKSILKDDLVNYAVCDRWAERILKELVVEIEKTESISIIPTFDIDNTFAYKFKTGSRKFLAVTKDRLTGNKQRILERKKVLHGEKDPYDTFDKILRIANEFKETKLFWLVGKWAKKDRNLSIHHPEHQKLIHSLKNKVEIGLHPSYASFLKEVKIAQEKSDLEKVIGNEVSISRQHFLRFSLPETFQSLINCGFKEEFSMGFADHIGFRCGTARSHNWFDLSKNEKSSLLIRPFVYMDGSLREYMKLSVEESKSKISQLYDEVKSFGGDFIFLWHNETIGDYGDWKGWSEVLEHTLKLKNE